MKNIRVMIQDRKGAVLTPSQLPCLSHAPSVNLTSGCAHGCLYCYSRTYSQYPGEGTVVVYGNTLQKLRDELHRKRNKPAFVYFSPSTDAFQPVEAVLDLAYDVFEFLLSQGVGIAFATKGVIPDKHMKLFESHPELVRAQIGLITLDSEILRTFEPGCASVDVRLRQIERLIQTGIKTEVRLDPILPGLTDDPISLEHLLETLSSLDVKQVALNVLYLRPILFKTLRERIPDEFQRDRLIKRYTHAERIRVCNGRFSQVALPRVEREDIFARAIRIAQSLRISCHCCGCMNPDLSDEICNLTGDWKPDKPRTDQLEFL